MSKRAEQRGLEALPPRWRKTKDGKGKIDSARHFAEWGAKHLKK